MNKPLKFLTRTIFLMFLVLFFAVTMIQFVDADELRANELNSRTLKNSYKVERGSILVDGEPIAFSVPTDDSYHFTREYSEGELYAPITGYYSHLQGMSGLESAMNKELSGTGDAQFFSRLLNTLNGVAPQGSSVETTINPAAQRAAFDALMEYDFVGAVVAIEPATGKILALASTPTYDPNLLSSNSDAQIIENYQALEDDPAQPLANRAVAGDLYPPGSVYKLVSASAILEAGKATPTTPLPNPSAYTLPGSTFQMKNTTNAACGPGDKTTLTEAIRISCNLPFAQLAAGMDLNAIPEMATAYGFGDELEIPFSTTASQAPKPEDAAQAALSSIGQFDVRATPLQIAMVSAGIANNGTVMYPQLVESVISPDLKVEQSFSEKEYSTPISSQTANEIAAMMELGVSSADGYANSSGIDGVRVAGKTGTAEMGNDEDGTVRPYTLWYTGFAPVDDPKVAVAVVVADGGGAAFNYDAMSSETTTIIGKRVMEAVLSE